MTDDWMDDDVAMGSIDSEEEEEGPEADKGLVETKIKNEVMNNYMYSIIDKYDVIIGDYK